uniref:Uncharacterized protein n=1 Tax=Anguilla anguilla TaxID=7936 RepID=A0A0E9QGS2_ANGAN
MLWGNIVLHVCHLIILSIFFVFVFILFSSNAGQDSLFKVCYLFLLYI